jgi:hypothetical protein
VGGAKAKHGPPWLPGSRPLITRLCKLTAFETSNTPTANSLGGRQRQTSSSAASLMRRAPRIAWEGFRLAIGRGAESRRNRAGHAGPAAACPLLPALSARALSTSSGAPARPAISKLLVVRWRAASVPAAILIAPWARVRLHAPPSGTGARAQHAVRAATRAAPEHSMQCVPPRERRPAPAPASCLGRLRVPPSTHHPFPCAGQPRRDRVPRAGHGTPPRDPDSCGFLRSRPARPVGGWVDGWMV